MNAGARNQFAGTVTRVTDGAVNAEVVLDVGSGLEVVATITREAVADLGLAPGAAATALIKASFVVLVPGEAPLRTSARNRFAGKIAAHRTGLVSDEVVLGLAGGRHLVAVVTHASGDGLGLQPGTPAQALVKASHVILAVE